MTLNLKFVLQVLKRSILIEVITIAYISLMLYTAVSKLSDYNLSREQMAMMPVMMPIAHIAAWLLPVIEMLLAISIFIPKTRITGLYAVTGLMVLFTFYIIYMMANYEHLPCSCGGLLQALSWKGHLIFNSIFIVLGVLAIVLYKKDAHYKMQYAPALGGN